MEKRRYYKSFRMLGILGKMTNDYESETCEHSQQYWKFFFSWNFLPSQNDKCESRLMAFQSLIG